jgi:hypothetical protein
VQWSDGSELAHGKAWEGIRGVLRHLQGALIIGVIRSGIDNHDILPLWQKRVKVDNRPLYYIEYHYEICKSSNSPSTVYCRPSQYCTISRKPTQWVGPLYFTISPISSPTPPPHCVIDDGSMLQRNVQRLTSAALKSTSYKIKQTYV